MKLLEPADYSKIFLNGVKHNNQETIIAYFSGKYNEVKECNPLPLFIEGVTRAYEGFLNQIKSEYYNALKEYDILCKMNPDIEFEKPDMDTTGFPAINVDFKLREHYNYSTIKRIKEGFDEFVRAERSKEYPKIEKLDLDSLRHSDIVVGYYERNWKFSIEHHDGIFDIPILESALALISDKKQMKFPWKAYVEGFCEEYKKPINGYSATPEGRVWLLRNIQPKPLLPTVSYKITPENEAYFSEEKAVEYGTYNAKAFKTWAVVIDELPVFEEIFKGKKGGSQKQTATIELTQKPTNFTPNPETLKDWVKSDYIPKFTDIEKELFDREYINETYKWIKSNNELIDFLNVIINYRFFKEIVIGKRKQYFHYRQFISERYKMGKLGLSESNKKHKPKFEIAKATFFWINKPD